MPARRLFIVLFVALLAGGAVAPSAAQQAASSNAPLTVAPERPQPGQPVTVRYDPQAEGARLQSPDTLELVVRSQRPDYRVLPMQRADGRWRVQFAPDSSARFLRLYVQSGSLKNQNGGGGREGAGWGRMLYGPGGEPVRGAYVARADYLRDHHGEDVPGALLKKAYRRELARHPGHLVAKAHLGALQAKKAAAEGYAPRADSLRQALVDELDDARRRHAGDFDKLREVQRAYHALGRRGMAQSVGATLMERDRDGPEAVLASFRRATAEGQSPSRMRRRVEGFLKRFPGSFFEGGLYEALFKKYRAAALADSARTDTAMVDSMRWAGRRWIRAEQINPARAHGRVAQGLAAAERYDAAARHARKAIAAVTEETPTGYAFFKTDGGWDWALTPRTPAARRVQARRQRGTHRAVLGRVSFRRGNHAKAAEVLARAARERPGDASIWSDLAKARKGAGQMKAAFAAAEEAVRRAPTSGSVRTLFRRLYVARHGSGDGLRAAAFELARPALLEQRLNRPAPTLRLTRLDSVAAGDSSSNAPRGDSLRLENLRGKVLVLDFWASWCGPCRQAFPHLQAVYETYRDAPDVAFLAVNTSWRQSKAQARRFIARNGYTFPLYWDAGGQVARAFGIRSIPSTVLVGKGGRVQYRESGFGGPGQYARNLTLRIEALRSPSPGDAPDAAPETPKAGR